MKQIACILSFLFTISISCVSQEYNYYHYDVKDGLSGNTVYAITQDKDGFMWFGTETGLSRFDGSYFKNYTAQDGLYDNEIINIFVDSKNRVWIFPFKSAVYYYYQGKIYNSTNDSLLKKFHLNDEIFNACEDRNGNIFFLEQKKLHILSVTDQLTEVDKINNFYFYNNTCGITTNGNCNLYIISLGSIKDHGVSIFEYQNSKFILKDRFQDSNYSRTAFEINQNYKVIKNGFNFQIHDDKNNRYFELKAPDHFRTISYINDSCFTLSTFNKTVLFNINQQKVVDSFLINKVTNRCFSDKENNLWFATKTEGVYRLSSTKFKLYKIEHNFNSLPVYAINSSNNNLYIGCERNLLWKLNLKNSELKPFYLNTEYNINHISNIQVNSNNDLLIGSNIGLFNFNNKKTSLFVPGLSVKSTFIEDSSVIIATDRAAFDISFSTRIPDTVWKSRATCAYKFNDQYFIGTLNGLFRVQRYPEYSITDLGNVFPPLKDKIITIKTDLSGVLWIATESNGLIGLKNNKIIYQLTTKNGLLSNLCRCFYISEQNLWVGSDKGISKINISSFPFKITNFTEADGLDCEIINCIYAKGDSVFAGTPYGVTFFDANATQATSVCNLKLLNIRSENQNWYFKQDSIKLSSKDNFLQFEYAGISFVSAGDITYYYQLKGLNDTWQSTKQNILEFQSLGPGKYELNIYAVNKYGVKSEMLIVPFTKAKAFWQLLWVQILAAVLVGVLIWLILRLRIKAVRNAANEKLMRERQINELEQMALRAQMNPHFIFNSLNSIQQYVFAGDVMEANEFITNFSSLVRQTLYISGKKFITLAEEIKYLDAYLEMEQAKYENIFRFQIISEENKTENAQVPPLLIQPFIENSIRHGVLNLENGRGEILVHFYRNSNFLFCIVEDNGVGREHALRLKRRTDVRHQSRGMELVQKRIENLNGIYNCDITVSIEDIIEENKTGTRVKIKLPLNYDE